MQQDDLTAAQHLLCTSQSPCFITTDSANLEIMYFFKGLQLTFLRSWTCVGNSW